MWVLKVSLTSLFRLSLSGKILSSKKHKFFRHHKNKSSSPIIVDNMSAIAQSAISFGTFPPSYPTFARDRDRNVSVSPASSFVVLLWVLFLSFFYSCSSSFLWSVLSGTRRDEERCDVEKGILIPIRYFSLFVARKRYRRRTKNNDGFLSPLTKQLRRRRRASSLPPLRVRISQQQQQKKRAEKLLSFCSLFSLCFSSSFHPLLLLFFLICPHVKRV